MTREQFIAKATRNAERHLRIPPGWWGTYRDVRGPGGRRVRFGQMNGCRGWIVSVGGKTISGHSSRPSAIAKARKWGADRG